MNAEVSPQLLVNIFVPKTPLHDGAVVISNNKIAAAACVLPLADNVDVGKGLGTRHRAAIGISKESDAIAVVVSEETGKVSVAKDGTLIADVREDVLKKILISNIVTKRFANPNTKSKNRFTKIKEKIVKNKNKNEKTEETNNEETTNEENKNEETKQEENNKNTQEENKVPMVPGTNDNNNNTPKDKGTINIQGLLNILGLLLALVALAFIIIVLAKRRNNVKIYIEEGDEKVLVGKEKVTKDNRELDLNKYYNKYKEEEYKIVLSKSISKKLDKKTVNLTVHDKKESFVVDYDSKEYIYRT